MTENYQELLDESKSYPHIAVYKQTKNGVQYGWRIQAEDGYLLMDSAESACEQSAPDAEPVAVVYLCPVIFCPLHYGFDNFSICAVKDEEASQDMQQASP